jgi:hypothetical protein
MTSCWRKRGTGWMRWPRRACWSGNRTSEGGDTINRYVLTAAGSRTEGKGRFCYGRRQVTSVEKFTAPVDYQGMPLTKVEYHFVLKNPPSWAKQDEVRNAFPMVAKSTSEEPVDEATLLLTHDGWVLTY